jgi:hypothetical protein
MKIKCIRCGEEFILEEGEKKFYKDKGFPYPKRCRDCRIVRKRYREKYEKNS